MAVKYEFAAFIVVNCRNKCGLYLFIRAAYLQLGRRQNDGMRNLPSKFPPRIFAACDITVANIDAARDPIIYASVSKMLT